LGWTHRGRFTSSQTQKTPKQKKESTTAEQLC
jgi:hypothetical protein